MKRPREGFAKGISESNDSHLRRYRNIAILGINPALTSAENPSARR